jgi:hypothetical protein
MSFGSGGPFGRQATPVSADDVARVVGRAFRERTWRIRLTAGQRGAILRRSLRPRPASGA